MSTDKQLNKHELKGNFVALRSGGLWLVLPQEQVAGTRRLDSELKLEYDQDRFGVFVAKSANNRTSYYAALSEQMTLLPKLPKSRYLLTSFHNSELYWCWDDVFVLIDLVLKCQEIPKVLLKPDTPLEALATWSDGEKVFNGFLCRAETVVDYVLSRSNEDKDI